eukprot:1601572-Pyramimonas_sp.AAC.1
MHYPDRRGMLRELKTFNPSCECIWGRVFPCHETIALGCIHFGFLTTCTRGCPYFARSFSTQAGTFTLGCTYSCSGGSPGDAHLVFPGTFTTGCTRIWGCTFFASRYALAHQARRGPAPTVGPRIRHLAIARFTKHAGVAVGPEGAAHACDRIIPRLLGRTLGAKRASLGPAVALRTLRLCSFSRRLLTLRLHAHGAH